MTDKTNIEEGLENIRKRRIIVWIIFFGFIPIALLISIVFTKEYIDYYVAVYGLLFLFSGLRVAFSHCPKCRKYYHTRFIIGVPLSNPWVRECLHCGLKLRQ